MYFTYMKCDSAYVRALLSYRIMNHIHCISHCKLCNVAFVCVQSHHNTLNFTQSLDPYNTFILTHLPTEFARLWNGTKSGQSLLHPCQEGASILGKTFLDLRPSLVEGNYARVPGRQYGKCCTGSGLRARSAEVWWLEWNPASPFPRHLLQMFISHSGFHEEKENPTGTKRGQT